MTQRIVPDFESIIWRCPCCKRDRQDKYLKFMTHDVSALFGHDTGTLILNARFCIDLPTCQDKALDRGWVIHNFFDKFVKDENAKIEV